MSFHSASDRVVRGPATLVRFLDRMADIRVSDEHHGPPDARRYEYDPTYMLRGLKELHLEFTRID